MRIIALFIVILCMRGHATAQELPHPGFLIPDTHMVFEPENFSDIPANGFTTGRLISMVCSNEKLENDLKGQRHIGQKRELILNSTSCFKWEPYKDYPVDALTEKCIRLGSYARSKLKEINLMKFEFGRPPLMSYEVFFMIEQDYIDAKKSKQTSYVRTHRVINISC